MSEVSAMGLSDAAGVGPAAFPRLPSLISGLLADQQRLQTPVANFADWHEQEHTQAKYYKDLIPLGKPGTGEQYAFEVNLDACTGCKACVVACHSLNGLDEEESWRDIGTITATAYQQTVTAACHHCVDPGCANGCPTLAYEKDKSTGIVRHLDDQCIGCSYCTMKCPYDVPKFNLKRGIVRKCDMCHGRLAAGEAPACVQACPNGAIAIRIVNQKEMVARKEVMLPGAHDSRYTKPTTRYVSQRAVPATAMAADASKVFTEETHNPLAIMLVLTQAAAGGLAAASLGIGDQVLLWVSTAMLIVGIAASVLHLGQPLKAWKSFLGWRKSWLSREIIAFGVAAKLAPLACLSLLPIWPEMLPVIPAWPAALTLLAGVACSVMVYVDTRRTFWRAAVTFPRFFGTAAIMGCALAACWQPLAALPAAVLMLGKLLWEMMGPETHPADYSMRVQKELLAVLWRARMALALAGMIGVFASPPAGAALLLISELLERALFFRAVKAYRMPGL